MIDNIKNEKKLLLKEIGVQLKDLRIKRGFTQHQLEEYFSREDGTSFLNLRKIQRIENGESNLNLFDLFIILQKLETSFSAFFSDFSKEEEEEEEEELKKAILSSLENMDYDEAEKKLLILKTKIKKNLSRQFSLWVEGMIQNSKYQNKKLAEKILLQGLAITLPKIINKKSGKIINTKFDIYDFTLQEIRIYMEIAHTKEGKEAIYMCEQLYTKIEKNIILTTEEKETFLSKLCFNISVTMLNEKIIQEKILDLSKKGIEIERSMNKYPCTGRHYYNIGRYFYEKNDLENAKKFFQQSYNFFFILQDFSNAEKTFNWSLDCGIKLKLSSNP